MSAADIETGVAAVNASGEVMVFVFPHTGEFTGFSSSGDTIVLEGERPVSRRYETVVSKAVAKRQLIQLAVVEEDGAIISLTDLERV